MASIDERIESTALAILRSRGPLAVNIEAVAAESGVAKTTIYRRFDNREQLLRAVVSSATTVVDIPSGLSAYETLRWYLGQALDTIEYVVGRGAVAAILVNEDPPFTALLLEMIRTRSKPLRENLASRAANGELKADLDIELLISVLLGTFVAESIRGHVREEGWADQVLRLLWPAVAPAEVAVSPAEVAVAPAEVAVAPAGVAGSTAEVAVAPAGVAGSPAEVAVGSLTGEDSNVATSPQAPDAAALAAVARL